MKLTRICLLVLLLGTSAFAQRAGPFTINASTSPCAQISVAVDHSSTVTIDVSGTFSATLQPKVAMAGQTAHNTQVTPSTSQTPQSTITAAGGYQALQVSGWELFEVCVSSYVSGTATIYLSISTGVVGQLGGGGGGGGDSITSPNNTLSVGGSSSSTTLDLNGAAGEIMAGATPALTATPTLGASGTTGSVTLVNTNGSTSNTITENTTGLTLGTVTSGTWNGTAITGSFLNMTGASCTNQVVTAISSGGTGTCTSLTSAYIPTLNQNTTGSAASLSVSGQTGLLSFTGITSTNRIKTVRDAADTLLELGGSYTPTGTWTNMALASATLSGASTVVPSGGTLTIQSGGTLTCAGGSTCPSGTGFANPMTTLGDAIYGGVSGAATRLAGPTGVNSVPQQLTTIPSAGAAVAPTWQPTGVPTNAQTGTTYTYVATDRASYVSFSNASSVAATLPASNSTGFASNWVNVSCDIGAGTATITPTTSTISYTTGSAYTSGASTLALTTGQCAWIYSDNTNYFAIVRGGGGAVSSVNTLTGAVVIEAATAGQMAVSGGASAALTGAADMTYSTHTFSTITTGIFDWSAATGTAALKVPSTTTNTASAAGVIDFDTTNKNYHGYVNAADSIFMNTAAAPTTNVIPKAVIASGNTLYANSLLIDTGTTATYTGTGGLDAPTFTATGTTAGFYDLPQGTTSLSVAPCNASTSICVQAPTSVTSYSKTLPGAAPVIASYEQTDTCGSSNCTVTFHPVPVVLQVTSNFTTANNTSLQTITGLTYTMPVSKAVNVQYHCALAWSQATGTAAVAFGIQGATTAPTNLLATATSYSNVTAETTGTLAALASTTATAIVSVAPSAITTIWKAEIDGSGEFASNASPTVLNFMVSTATGADAVTVYRDSACKLDFQ